MLPVEQVLDGLMLGDGTLEMYKATSARLAVRPYVEQVSCMMYKIDLRRMSPME